MSKLQTYISERKGKFRDRFVVEDEYNKRFRMMSEESQIKELESFNEETIEQVLAIVREVVESKREKELFIGKTQYDFYKGDVAWVNNAPLDDILQALNTKE